MNSPCSSTYALYRARISDSAVAPRPAPFACTGPQQREYARPDPQGQVSISAMCRMSGTLPVGDEGPGATVVSA